MRLDLVTRGLRLTGRDRLLLDYRLVVALSLYLVLRFGTLTLDGCQCISRQWKGLGSG